MTDMFPSSWRSPDACVRWFSRSTCLALSSMPSATVAQTHTASYEKWDDAFCASRIRHILRITRRHEALLCHDAHGRRGGDEDAEPNTQKRSPGRDPSPHETQNRGIDRMPHEPIGAARHQAAGRMIG